MITSLTYRSFKLPFSAPLILAGQQYSAREGYLVWLEDDQGEMGVGEIAPLPGFSEETAGEIPDLLEQVRHTLPWEIDDYEILEQLVEPVKSIQLPASAQFGLEEALLDLTCRRMGIRLQDYLEGDGVDELPVNGYIGMCPVEQVKKRTHKLVSRGYRTLKVKVGRNEFRKDLEVLEAVRSGAESVSLRLDANRAWTLDNAIAHLDELVKFNIEYIEEPVRDATPELLRRCREESQVPLAADESARSHEEIILLLSWNAVDYYVLKPTLLGGFIETIRLAKTIQGARAQTILTSTYNTTVGLAGIAQLAAALAPDQIHGLSTRDLFANPIFDPRDYSIEQGSLHLPEEPGLGIDFKPEDMD